MTEETIFAEALEKTTPSERAAYLDKACAGDTVLRQRLETLLKSHEAGGDFLGKPAIQRAVEELEGRACGEPTQGELPGGTDGHSLDFLDPSQKPDSLGRFGHYEIIEVIGRGGMGVVLKALDESLQRVVAVKVIGAQLAVSGTGRQRFVREARAAAAVRDEHVVGIHSVAETGDLPYLVMEYVAGQSLQERLDRDGPLAPKEVLRIGLQIAQGLAAAHKQGLIHRDIKPSNILLENGVERAKITDFGLARAADDASLTQSGVISGTPQYMAPEQAHGKAVDQRADLFSLGSVLYAMCTGRPPFRASGTMAVLKRVCEETPRPIRETNSDVPDWLVGIIDKLHAKDPAGRYQTAAEVAELLNQCLAHLQQPLVVPPPVTRPGRPPSAWRRHRVVVAVVLLSLAAVLALTEAAGVTRLTVTISGLFVPGGTPVAGVDGPNGKAGVKVPAQSKTLSTSGELRRFEGHTNCVWCVAYSADGRHALSGAADSTVRLWDIWAGKELRCFEGHIGGVTGVAISSDERLGVSSGGDGHVILWDLETGKEVRRCDKHTAPLYCVAISPDGKVAVAGSRGVVIVWDVQTGKELRRFKGHRDLILSVAFSSDGRHILSGGGAESRHPYPPDADLTMRRWDVKTGEELTTFKGHTLWVQCVAVSPDGHSALSGSYDGTIRLWDIQTGKQLRSFNHPSGVGAVAFCPNGPYFLSGGDSPYHVYLRDLKTGKQLHRFEGHAHKIQSLAFSPDGKTFLSGSWDGTMRLWQLPELSSVKAAKPVLLMHFDKADFYEKDGKTYVRDRSGNGHDGLCEQVQFTPEGKTGGGLANAGKGFLRLKSSLITGKSNFAIAGWAKPTGLKRGYAFYTCKNSDYPVRELPCFNFFHNGNCLYAGVWNTAHGWMHVQSPEQNISPGEWIFIAATLEHGAPGRGRLRLMLNDRICEKSSQQVGGVSLEGVNDFAGLNLEGVLDELAVWDCALSDQELRELFALGHAPAGRAPAAVAAVKAKSLDPDRKAAGYVLSIGGTVCVDEENRALKATADLPPEPFRLTSVALSHNKQVSDAGLAAFKDCKNLTHLHLGGTQVSNAGLTHFKDCKNLMVLWLHHTQVSDAGLAHFKDCKNLRSLHLACTQVSDAGLAHFKDCKSLTQLDLENTKVSNTGLEYFQGCKDLTSLVLRYTQVGDAGLAHLKDCKNLTLLHLRSTRVSDAGLAYFRDCRNLTHLYLGGTQVGNAGLAHFKDCKDLIILALDNTQVTDAGLAHFKDCKNLTTLGLDNIQVSDEGLGYFKDCKNLTELTLSETQVSDAGLKHLAGLKKLDSLDLRRTRATAAGVAELQKALPRCKIDWACKAAPATPPPEAAKRELAKWQGEWENADFGRLASNGDRWSWHPKEGAEVVSTIKIVEVTDKMTHVLLLNTGLDAKVRTIQTILRVDGETLHNCGTIGPVRTTEFAGKPGYLYVKWKRVTRPPP